MRHVKYKVETGWTPFSEVIHREFERVMKAKFERLYREDFQKSLVLIFPERTKAQEHAAFDWRMYVESIPYTPFVEKGGRE